MTAPGREARSAGALRALCAAVALFVHTGRANAQAGEIASPWRANAWLTGALAAPVLVPEPHLDTSYGLGFGAGVGWSLLPLGLGFDVAALRGSGDTTSTTLSLGGAPATLIATKTRQVVFVDAWLRAQSPGGSFRPYAEVSGGVAMIDYIESLRFPNAVTGTATFGRQASTPTFGVGLGAEVVIARAREDPSSVLALTFGLRHVWGTRTPTEPGLSRAPELRTETTLVLIGLGARARFGGNASPSRS